MQGLISGSCIGKEDIVSEENEEFYCCECLRYDYENEQIIGEDMMAICNKKCCLVNNSDKACEDFAY